MAEAIVNFGTSTDRQIRKLRVLRCVERDVARAAGAGSERHRYACRWIASEGIDRLEGRLRPGGYRLQRGEGLEAVKPRDHGRLAPQSARPRRPASQPRRAIRQGGPDLSGQDRAAPSSSPPGSVRARADQAKVLAFVADPAEAAKVYGQDHRHLLRLQRDAAQSEWKTPRNRPGVRREVRLVM